MKNNFKDSIKNNINTSLQDDKSINDKGSTSTEGIDTVKGESSENAASKFTIAKKLDDKKGKKAFNVYMDPQLVKELDRVSKRTNWSRNELINKMCEYCLENINIEE